MSGPALTLMVIVLVVVFGGTILALFAAWRQELRRRERGEPEETDRGPT